MAETATDNSNPQEAKDPMVHMFSPEGEHAQLPQSAVDEYINKYKFTRAVRMTSPEGEGAWLNRKDVDEYTKNHGFKVGQPEAQGKPESTMHRLATDAVAAPGTDRDVAGNLVDQFTPDSGTPGRVVKTTGKFVAGIPKMAWDVTAQPMIDNAVIQASSGYTPGEKLKSAAVNNPVVAPIKKLFVDPVLAANQRAKQSAEKSPAGEPDYAGVIQSSLEATPIAGSMAASVKDKAAAGDNAGALTEGALDVASLATGAPETSLLRKLGAPVDAATTALAKTTKAVPALVKGTADTITRQPGTLFAKPGTLGPVESAVKATKPRNSIPNIKQSLGMALPDAVRAANNKGLKVETLDHALDATLQAKKEVWQEHDNRFSPNKQTTIDGNKIADAMEAKITKRFEEQNPKAAKAIRNKAKAYRRDMTIGEAEDYLQDANNELYSHYQKNKIGQDVAERDPATGHMVAEAKTLRQIINDKLDSINGPGTALIKQRYGALKTMEDVLRRRINVADRAAPESLIEQIGKQQLMMGVGKGTVKTLLGNPVSGISDIVGGVRAYRAGKASRLANDSNTLIKQAFDKTKANPNTAPAIQAKPNAGALPPVPKPQLLPSAPNFPLGGNQPIPGTPKPPTATAAFPDMVQTATPAFTRIPGKGIIAGKNVETGMNADIGNYPASMANKTNIPIEKQTGTYKPGEIKVTEPRQVQTEPTRTIYHGTSSKNRPSIKQRGIEARPLPPTAAELKSKGHTHGVYLGANKQIAHQNMELAGIPLHERIIVEAKMPKSAMDKSVVDPEFGLEGARFYPGHIPPEAITKVHIYNPKTGTYEPESYPAGGKPQSQTPKGKLPLSSAMEYLKIHGGDKNLARQAARNDGWNV